MATHHHPDDDKQIEQTLKQRGGQLQQADDTVLFDYHLTRPDGTREPVYIVTENEPLTWRLLCAISWAAQKRLPLTVIGTDVDTLNSLLRAVRYWPRGQERRGVVLPTIPGWYCSDGGGAWALPPDTARGRWLCDSTNRLRYIVDGTVLAHGPLTESLSTYETHLHRIKCHDGVCSVQTPGNEVRLSGNPEAIAERCHLVEFPLLQPCLQPARTVRWFVYAAGQLQPLTNLTRPVNSAKNIRSLIHRFFKTFVYVDEEIPSERSLTRRELNGQIDRWCLTHGVDHRTNEYLLWKVCQAFDSEMLDGPSGYNAVFRYPTTVDSPLLQRLHERPEPVVDSIYDVLHGR